MATKLCVWGNSLGVRLPKHIAERTGLVAGDYLYIRLMDSGDIVMRPVKAKDLHAGYAPLLTQPMQKEPDIPSQW